MSNFEEANRQESLRMYREMLERSKPEDMVATLRGLWHTSEGKMGDSDRAWIGFAADWVLYHYCPAPDWEEHERRRLERWSEEEL